MKYTLSLQFDSLSELQLALIKLDGPRPMDVAEAQPETEKKTRKARSDAGQPRGPYSPRKEETAAPEQPVAEVATPQAVPAAAASAAFTPATVTKDQVIAAMKVLNAKRGIEANMTVLKKFGVEKLSKLPEEKYGDFLKAVMDATK